MESIFFDLCPSTFPSWVAERKIKDKIKAMKSSVIAIDPQIMSGAPCFVGTRVPIQALFDYLNGGHPLADFLEKDFPSVTAAQVHRLLNEAKDGLAVAED